MPRTATTFLSLLDEFCRNVQNQPEGSITGVVRANFIQYLNAAYRAAWQYNGVPWEDSWQCGSVPVVAGEIAWSALGDAHVFNLWSADPRPDNRAAQWIEASSGKNGLFVGASWNAGVYGFWRPVCPQWDGSSTSASAITLLKDATLAFAEAAYYRANGQLITASQRRKDAQDMLEDLAAIEFERVQHHWWLRRKS